MRLFKGFPTLAVLSTVMGLSAPLAHGATVELSYQGKHAFGSPFWAEAVHRTTHGATKHVWAGQFRLTDGVNALLAFCIEPNVWLNVNEAYAINATAATPQQMAAIQGLYDTSYDKVTGRASAAGFQLALWEIMVETGTGQGYDLTSGAHSVLASTAALAAGQGFLAAMAAGGAPAYALTTFVNSGQNLVSGTPRTTLASTAAVPLPSSVWTLLAGLIAMLGFARVTQRRAA